MKSLLNEMQLWDSDWFDDPEGPLRTAEERKSAADAAAVLVFSMLTALAIAAGAAFRVSYHAPSSAGPIEQRGMDTVDNLYSQLPFGGFRVSSENENLPALLTPARWQVDLTRQRYQLTFRATLERIHRELPEVILLQERYRPLEVRGTLTIRNVDSLAARGLAEIGSLDSVFDDMLPALHRALSAERAIAYQAPESYKQEVQSTFSTVLKNSYNLSADHFAALHINLDVQQVTRLPPGTAAGIARVSGDRGIALTKCTPSYGFAWPVMRSMVPWSIGVCGFLVPALVLRSSAPRSLWLLFKHAHHQGI